MKILVTGANGFLGRSLCHSLETKGIEFVAASRNTGAAEFSTRIVKIGDINKETDWSKAFEGVDVVVHCAAITTTKDNSPDLYTSVNVEGSRNLANQAIAKGIKRFVFISSIKVNGEITTAHSFNETCEPNPQDDYAMSKYMGERELTDLFVHSGTDFVIIRPPLVYGPGVKGNFSLLERLVSSHIPIPLGLDTNKRAFIAIDNLVDFICVCIKHPLAANEVFVVSDCQDISTYELLREISFAKGVSLVTIPVPKLLIKLLLSILGKEAMYQRLYGSLQIDGSKSHRLLGWTPSISIQEGLAKCFRGEK